MKVGDLVECWSTSETGIIVDIDYDYEYGEIVVLLSCGTCWRAYIENWEVLSEDR